MISRRSGPFVEKATLLFVFPLIYRPQKDNVAKKFRLLSVWFRGHIFTLSGSKQRNLPIADFLFHSEEECTGKLGRLLPGLRAQILLPVKLLLRKTRPVAIIAYDPFRSGLAGFILKLIFRCKLVIEVNGDFHAGYGRNETGLSWSVRVFKAILVRVTLGYADAIRVLNSSQEIFYRGAFPQKKIFRFPDFVATDYFESLSPYQGDYLLSVGTPFHGKGMDVLIKAFLRIAETRSFASLRIMGYCPGSDLEEYKSIAGGHPRIQFIEPGWMEDVGEQIRGCYALVNAARSEAMGRVHVEAMACAKPIIATRTNGASECIEDGQTGLLCEIDDVEGLADKLSEMLSDRGRAVTMGLAGRARMHSLYSEKRWIAAFRQMIEEVVGVSNPASEA